MPTEKLYTILSAQVFDPVAAQEAIEAGADVNALRPDGKSRLLDIAVGHDCREKDDSMARVRFMLDRGANPRLANDEGRDSFGYALMMYKYFPKARDVLLFLDHYPAMRDLEQARLIKKVHQGTPRKLPRHRPDFGP